MRYPDDPLHAGAWRLDASLRYVDQGRRLTGRDASPEVFRPRIDLRLGAFEASSHQETGEAMTFLQLDLSRRLGGSLMASATFPLYRRRSIQSLHLDGVAAPPADAAHGADDRKNATSGIGDLLVGMRWTPLSAGGRELTSGFTIKLPTGPSSLPGPDGVVDPMLQPGTGAVDFVGSLQYVGRVSRTTLSAIGSYQKTTTNAEGYRYGDDLVGALGVSGALGARVIGQFQVKAQKAGRHHFQGEPVPSTGHMLVELVQGLRIRVNRGLTTYGTLQLPAYAKVNESQLAPRLTLTAGFVTAF
jgi:hypothetical protein